MILNGYNMEEEIKYFKTKYYQKLLKDATTILTILLIYVAIFIPLYDAEYVKNVDTGFNILLAVLLAIFVVFTFAAYFNSYFNYWWKYIFYKKIKYNGITFLYTIDEEKDVVIIFDLDGNNHYTSITSDGSIPASKFERIIEDSYVKYNIEKSKKVNKHRNLKIDIDG